MSTIFNCADKKQKEKLLAILRIQPDIKLEFLFMQEWVRRNSRPPRWEWADLSNIPYRIAEEKKDEPDI